MSNTHLTYYSCSSVFPTHSCKLCILVLLVQSAISNLVDRRKLLVCSDQGQSICRFLVSLDVVHEVYMGSCVCVYVSKTGVSRIALHLTVVT